MGLLMASFRSRGGERWLALQISTDAASHARWAAKANGGRITVYDPQGKLFKTIEIEPDITDGDPYVLPSV